MKRQDINNTTIYQRIAIERRKKKLDKALKLCPEILSLINSTNNITGESKDMLTLDKCKNFERSVKLYKILVDSPAKQIIYGRKGKYSTIKLLTNTLLTYD